MMLIWLLLVYSVGFMCGRWRHLANFVTAVHAAGPCVFVDEKWHDELAPVIVRHLFPSPSPFPFSLSIPILLQWGIVLTIANLGLCLSVDVTTETIWFSICASKSTASQVIIQEYNEQCIRARNIIFNVLVCREYLYSALSSVCFLAKLGSFFFVQYV